MFCTCKDCKAAKRKGYVLGSRLLKHLGSKAYYVSAYVKYHRYNKGKRPE